MNSAVSKGCSLRCRYGRRGCANIALDLLSSHPTSSFCDMFYSCIVCFAITFLAMEVLSLRKDQLMM